MVEITLLSDNNSNNWPRDGMVDIADLESVPLWEYRFKSGRGYQILCYMFSFVTLGTNDHKKSKFFYDELL